MSFALRNVFRSGLLCRRELHVVSCISVYTQRRLVPTQIEDIEIHRLWRRYYFSHSLPRIQDSLVCPFSKNKLCERTYLTSVPNAAVNVAIPTSHVAGTDEQTNLKSTTNSRKTPNYVAYWLFGCSAIVFGMVVLGGITRLTESGLSITEWKPVTGIAPPLAEEEWEREFEKYKQTPEFVRLHHDFTISDFKRIYWYEYSHRLLGRFLGLVYVVPMTYFILRGKAIGPMRNRLLVLGSLLAGQGALGWYMVKSGLRDELHFSEETPRVSPYRLAAHLSTAFILYSGMFITSLKILHSERYVDLKKQSGSLDAILLRSRWAAACKTLVFLTAVSGAFVAGLDAGLTYNTFPKMGGKWIPDDLLVITPAWRNAFENPTAAQFIHRVLGVSVLGVITGTWIVARKVPSLSPNARLALNCMTGMAYIQATLGISTLLTFVPVSLAATHQAGSLTLLTCALWFWHALRFVPK